MPIYKFVKGQLYKLVNARIIRVNGKCVSPDKGGYIRMWIPVDDRD